MGLKELITDFWYFLTQYKAWWITPIVLILVVLAIVAMTTDDPAVVPFIYAD